jgi:hypothetical protein
MILRSARSALRRISSVRGAALCGVLVSGGLVASTGFASASAHPSVRPTSERMHATSAALRPGRCRRARRALTRGDTACPSPHASGSQGASRTLRITSGPASGSTSASSRASFAFSSTAAHARFKCSIDAKPYAGCSSRASYRGLANGVHSFKVYAVAGGVDGTAASVIWKVETMASDTRPPSTPSGLVAIAGAAQVALRWRASTDAVKVAGYRVFGNGAEVAQVAAPAFTDTGLTDGKTYTYRVEAFDVDANRSALSAPVSAKPVAARTTPGTGSDPSPTPPTSTGSDPSPTPPTGTGSDPSPTPGAGTSGTGGGPPAPLTSWVAAIAGHFTPLSDSAAAADVTPTPENRPDNSAANAYMPTESQLDAFYSTINGNGQTVVAANPYDHYVTGHYTGTTDEIIQWAAWKWGIPADWLRAEYVAESHWNMSQLGDLTTVTPAVYSEYPPQARVAGTDEVYQSMGITQIKWNPNGSVGAGTEPLRWESTAFNVDYQAATLRFYFDDPDGLRSAWGDSTYTAGNAWASLGGWFEPYPWLNAGQLNYIAAVQALLAARTWAQPGF